MKRCAVSSIQTSAVTTPPPAFPADGVIRNVLIVDDSRAQRMMVETGLRGRGFTVHHAASGAEAAASFVLRTMRDDDGALARTFAAGRTSGAGVLEDHAAMARAL